MKRCPDLSVDPKASLSRCRCSLWPLGASRDQEQEQSWVAFGPWWGEGDNTLPTVAFFTVPPQRAAEEEALLLHCNMEAKTFCCIWNFSNLAPLWNQPLQLCSYSPLQLGSLPLHTGREALRQVSSASPCRWYPIWQWKRALPPGSKSSTDTSPKWGLFGREQLSLKTLNKERGGWQMLHAFYFYCRTNERSIQGIIDY